MSSNMGYFGTWFRLETPSVGLGLDWRLHGKDFLVTCRTMTSASLWLTVMATSWQHSCYEQSFTHLCCATVSSGSVVMLISYQKSPPTVIFCDWWLKNTNIQTPSGVFLETAFPSTKYGNMIWIYHPPALHSVLTMTSISIY